VSVRGCVVTVTNSTEISVARLRRLVERRRDGVAAIVSCVMSTFLADTLLQTRTILPPHLISLLAYTGYIFVY